MFHKRRRNPLNHAVALVALPRKTHLGMIRTFSAPVVRLVATAALRFNNAKSLLSRLAMTGLTIQLCMCTNEDGERSGMNGLRINVLPALIAMAGSAFIGELIFMDIRVARLTLGRRQRKIPDVVTV